MKHLPAITYRPGGFGEPLLQSHDVPQNPTAAECRTERTKMISASDRIDLEDARRLLEEVGYTDPDLLANAAGEPWARVAARLSHRLKAAERQVDLLWQQIRLLRLRLQQEGS